VYSEQLRCRCEVIQYLQPNYVSFLMKVASLQDVKTSKLLATVLKNWL